VAPAGATRCPACGAALAQREDLGGLLVPGVTGVHPELAAAADRPLHLTGPSASQGLASGLVAAAAMPGAAGLVLTGGIVAVAAAEYLGVPGAGLDAPDPASIGRPSEAVLAMVARLDSLSGGGSAVVVDGSPGNSDNPTRD
jgi:hypothetical protein